MPEGRRRYAAGDHTDLFVSLKDRVSMSRRGLSGLTLKTDADSRGSALFLFFQNWAPRKGAGSRKIDKKSKSGLQRCDLGREILPIER
jgi:hypothetical protein